MALVSRLLARVEHDPGVHYFNPELPAICSLPGGLNIGQKIHIRGVIDPEPDRFSVAFLRGSDVEEADIYFQLESRFKPEPGSIAKRSRSHGEWGDDDLQNGGKFPFAPGGEVLLTITVYLDTFEVETNCQPLTVFQQRKELPFHNVTHLLVQGDISISAIHILTTETMPKNLRLIIPGQVTWGDAFVFQLPEAEEDAIVEPEEYTLSLQYGPGRMEDIIYHLRLTTEKTAIQNSRIDDQWGTEVKDNDVTFERGSRLVVWLTKDHVTSAVGSKILHSFPLRLDPQQASYLVFGGIVKWASLFSIKGCVPRPLSKGQVLSFKSPLIQACHLQRPPVDLKLEKKMEPQNILIVSGWFPKENAKLEISLLENDDSVAVPLRIECLVDSDASNLLAKRKSEEDKWTDEKMVESRTLFQAGCHFEFLISYIDDAYHIYGNLSPKLRYVQKLEPIGHVRVEGCDEILRVLLV